MAWNAFGRFDGHAIAVRGGEEPRHDRRWFADEVAIDHFLARKIPFLFIPKIIRRMLDMSGGEGNFSSVHELLQYDSTIRQETRRLIERDYLH